VAECAVRVRPSAQARAGLGGICRRVLGTDDVRRAAPGADRSVLVWRVVMGDIGEEITEIELEPWPEEPPPAEAPVEPATEPVPG